MLHIQFVVQFKYPDQLPKFLDNLLTEGIRFNSGMSQRNTACKLSPHHNHHLERSWSIFCSSFYIENFLHGCIDLLLSAEEGQAQDKEEKETRRKCMMAIFSRWNMWRYLLFQLDWMMWKWTEFIYSTRGRKTGKAVRSVIDLSQCMSATFIGPAAKYDLLKYDLLEVCLSDICHSQCVSELLLLFLWFIPAVYIRGPLVCLCLRLWRGWWWDEKTRRGAISERAPAYTRTLTLIYNAARHGDKNT